MGPEWHTLTGFSKSSITSAVNPRRHEPRRRVTGCTHTGSKFPKSHPVLPLASLRLEPDSLELDQVSHSHVAVRRLRALRKPAFSSPICLHRVLYGHSPRQANPRSELPQRPLISPKPHIPTTIESPSQDPVGTALDAVLRPCEHR